MTDKEIDEMFEEHLSPVEMDVDVVDIWQTVEPPKKKKRKVFFLLWFLVGAFFCSGLGYLYWYKTDSTFIENVSDEQSQPIAEQTEVKRSNAILDEKQNKKYLNEEYSGDINEPQQSSSSRSKGTEGKEATLDGQVPSKNANLKTYVDKANSLREDNNTNVKLKKETFELKSIDPQQMILPTIEPLKNGRLNNSITVEDDIASSFSSDKLETSDAIAAESTADQIAHFEAPLHLALAGLDPLLTLNDLLTQVHFPLDTSQFKNEPQVKIRKFQLGIATGFGSFKTNLNATIPEGDALIADRKRTETDRVSYYLGTNLDYWISKNIGVSLGFEYQRHFSYFEEEIDFNDYSLTVYRTTYATNRRRIKSNLILNQFHTSLLFNYRIGLRKVKLVFSAGPSYNLYNKGEGKRYGENEEVVDLNQQGEPLQSTSVGLMAKCRIEYPLTKSIQINAGINTHYQLRAIVSDSVVKQRIRTSNFSLGLSHFF